MKYLGVRVGGKNVTSIRFADDQAMLTSSERDLQEVMGKMEPVVARYDMKIGTKKTKVLKIGGTESAVNIKVNSTALEQVAKYRYLGSLIAQSGSSEPEIRSRIAMAMHVFDRNSHFLQSGINERLKKRLLKCLVWTVFTYGAEMWAMKKSDLRKMEAFEMWCWRKMMKISWQVMRHESLLRD